MKGSKVVCAIPRPRALRSVGNDRRRGGPATPGIDPICLLISLPMTEPEILQKLLSIVRNVLDDDDVDFEMDTAVRDVPEWDSLNNMHIVVRMEKAMGVDLQQSDFEGVATVGDLVRVFARSKT